MKYYKILNEEECHRGLSYKTGLNRDVLPFNPSGTCEPGGIYFAREEILYFLNYGPWIREVVVPDDALVYEDIGKWKANRVILGERRRINDEVIRELIDEGAKIYPSIVNFIKGPDLLSHIFDITNDQIFITRCNSFILESDRIELFEVVLKYSIKPTIYMLERAAHSNSFMIAKCLMANGIQPNFTVRAFARQPHCQHRLCRLILDNE